jgi:hypothetical protein
MIDDTGRLLQSLSAAILKKSNNCSFQNALNHFFSNHNQQLILTASTGPNHAYRRPPRQTSLENIE